MRWYDVNVYNIRKIRILFLLSSCCTFACFGGIFVSEQKNKVSVQIHGQTYQLVGPESTGHLRLVATMVDEKMREIESRNKTLDINKIAVLTAVNAMHEYLKVSEQLERLEQANKLKD